MATQAEVTAFIEKIAPLIVKEGTARGYKVFSPIIAQACVESAYGTSSLGWKYHNYFGMKCGSSWKGKSVNLSTKEEYNSQLVSIRDNFRVYDSIEEGVQGYFNFISTSRYANLKGAVTPEMYLALIKSDGYATSSKYVNTCLACVKSNNLTRFDVIGKPITPELICDIIAGKYGNGAARKTNLINNGYDADAVQKKVNDLYKLSQELKPFKDKAGEFWPAVIQFLS